MFATSARRLGVAVARPSISSATKRSLPRTMASRAHQQAARGDGDYARTLGLAAVGVALASSLGYASCEEKMRYTVYDLPLGKKAPEEVPCFVEVSKGSRNKYEWDNELGFMKLDRVLSSAVFYPHDYGFIPQTLCGDGDPLDVLVLGDAPLVPGCVVDVRPIAYMVMEDEKGLDEKVLAVCAKDPRYQDVKTLRDVPEHTLREIAHFFETYKQLEKSKWVKVGGWKGTEDTKKLIEETHQTYLKAKEDLPAGEEMSYAKN